MGEDWRLQLSLANAHCVALREEVERLTAASIKASREASSVSALFATAKSHLHESRAVVNQLCIKMKAVRVEISAIDGLLSNRIALKSDLKKSFADLRKKKAQQTLDALRSQSVGAPSTDSATDLTHLSSQIDTLESEIVSLQEEKTQHVAKLLALVESFEASAGSIFRTDGTDGDANATMTEAEIESIVQAIPPPPPWPSARFKTPPPLGETSLPPLSPVSQPNDESSVFDASIVADDEAIASKRRSLVDGSEVKRLSKAVTDAIERLEASMGLWCV
jgi:hypothetical protein